MEQDPGSEAWVCERHARLAEDTRKEEARLAALGAARAFVKSETEKRVTTGQFAELAYTFRDTVTERAAEAAVGARVSELLAQQGPEGREPEDEMQRLVGANMLVRADAMTSALAIFDGKREPDEPERLLAYAAVRYAAGLVSKEYEKFRKQQGLGE